MKKTILMIALCIFAFCTNAVCVCAEETDLFPTSAVYLSSYYSTSDVKPGTQDSMCDNDNTTYWASKEGGMSLGRMIVDLGSEVNISKIEFVTTNLPNTRKDFSIYVTNDSECASLTKVVGYTASDLLQSGELVSIYPEQGEKYRYVVAQTNSVSMQVGFAEFRVFADCENPADNRLINISGFAGGFVNSGAYNTGVYTSPMKVANLVPSQIWTSSTSYNKESYIYLDLGSAQKIDSVALSTNVSSEVNANVTNKEMLRTDFQIVAKNDNTSAPQTEVVLYDHTGTLAKGVGDFTNLCVIEIPEQYKNEKFRFVGIRKKPTANNQNIGQMCIASFDVYSKESECNESFGEIKAKFNKQKNTLTVEFAARTEIDKKYQILTAYYDSNSRLLEIDASNSLMPASDTYASQAGEEILVLGYPSYITKTYNINNPSAISFAKVYILDDKNVRPVAKSRMISINSQEDNVDLVYDNVRHFTELPENSRYFEECRQFTKEFTWDVADGAAYYDFAVSTDKNYSYLTCSKRVSENYVEADGLSARITYYWKAVSDTGVTATGTVYTDASCQKPHKINWEEVPGAASYIMYLSEDSDFSKCKEYATKSNFALVNNLNLATTYYWKSVSDNGAEQFGQFRTTAEAPRLITTEGTTNVRDIGGWLTESGKRVKTGFVYRGAALDPTIGTTNNYQITENDKKMFLDDLGIKSHIDLRTDAAAASAVTSPLGSETEYHRFSMSSGYASDMTASWAYPSIRKVFQYMADESKYPIYFHCSAGADRTGTIALLLNGLLGVSEDDLKRDYEFTSFSRASYVSLQGEKGQKFVGTIELLNSYDGDTLSEKIESYLLSIGVTTEDIENIKRIMLE